MPLNKTLLVGGKWQIGQLIGIGAAGEVYSAIDDDSGETVAIKFEHRGASLLKKERDIYERLAGKFGRTIKQNSWDSQSLLLRYAW